MTGSTERESARRLSDCVTTLLRTQPFFGSLALRLPLRPDATRVTLASDGQEIRYSPEWIGDSDAEAIHTAMARVVLACALKHHTRRGDRSPERWQVASQRVTHGLLRDAGFTLPSDAIAWDGISVEEAYERLTSDGGHSPDGDDTNDPAGHGDDSMEVATTGSGSPESCDPAGTGEVMDAADRKGMGDDPDAGPLDIAAEEQGWDEALHQAASLARAQGSVPGGVERAIGSAHVGTLDWRNLLRRFMTDAARADYSWSLPNRRFIDGGLYLPSIRSEGLNEIAVILDTSGSLPDHILTGFWNEIRELGRELQPGRVTILQVDRALQEVSDYAPDELPDQIVLRGGGGTDFRPGFEWLEREGRQPSLCLYLTDMECGSYPETEPDFPVLWLNWGQEPEDWNREPWGERIDITD